MEFHDNDQGDREDVEGDEEDEEEDNGDELDDDIMAEFSPPQIYPNSLRNPPRLTEQASVTLQKPIKYKECRKNHAVGIGGHAVDGCGEFMASGAEGTLDALVCAACNCHRNFHRKESYSAAFPLSIVERAATRSVGAPPYPVYRDPNWYQVPMGPPPPLQHHPRPLALPPVNPAAFPMEMQDDAWNCRNAFFSGGGSSGGGSGSSRKRFRTKFSQEQKDRMLNLAEKLGWRIQKNDEAEVDRFCCETGVKRQVLKVWMHNNKHTLGKKP